MHSQNLGFFSPWKKWTRLWRKPPLTAHLFLCITSFSSSLKSQLVAWKTENFHNCTFGAPSMSDEQNFWFTLWRYHLNWRKVLNSTSRCTWNSLQVKLVSWAEKNELFLKWHDVIEYNWLTRDYDRFVRSEKARWEWGQCSSPHEVKFSNDVCDLNGKENYFPDKNGWG